MTKIGRLLYVTRPILSPDISAINLAVELVVISLRKSGDKIGRFYRSSVIGFNHKPGGRLSLLSIRSAIERSPHWQVPNYIACWQRHRGVSNLPKAITQWCPARTRPQPVNRRSVALPIAQLHQHSSSHHSGVLRLFLHYFAINDVILFSRRCTLRGVSLSRCLTTECCKWETGTIWRFLLSQQMVHTPLTITIFSIVSSLTKIRGHCLPTATVILLSSVVHLAYSLY